MDACVVLLHGMFRDCRDMDYLKEGLAALGYGTLAPTLPTTFGDLAACVGKLELDLNAKLEDCDRVHFVAHSVGGLVLRAYLARNAVPNVGRCVLIGVPNRGVVLTKALAWNPFFGRVLRMLPALVPPGPAIGASWTGPLPETGLIGGTVNKGIFFGPLFGGRSDGRVSVDAVPFDGAKETAWLPRNHHELHWDPQALGLVVRFLSTGTFQVKATSSF